MKVTLLVEAALQQLFSYLLSGDDLSTSQSGYVSIIEKLMSQSAEYAVVRATCEDRLSKYPII